MRQARRIAVEGLLVLNGVLLGLLAYNRTRAPVAAGPKAPAPSFSLERSAVAAPLGGNRADLRRTPIVDAAEHVSPSVVSINATQTQVVLEVDPFDFFGPFLPYRQFEQENPTLGSGLIVTEDGYILTNHHVVGNATSISVSLSDGREFPAKLVDADKYVDIAVLKVDAKGLPPAELGTSSDLMIGEWALAIGNPFAAFDEDPRPSVSVGAISATNRFFQPDEIEGFTHIYQNMIQTDAAINPGNSGGPLVNILGQVIGINTFIFSKTGGSQGIGFATPIDRAKAVYEEVRQFGRVRPLARDFDVRTMNPNFARHFGLPLDTTGAMVWEIVGKSGAAAEAGLQPGDVIVRADHKAIRTREDLYNYFFTLQVGAKVELECLREGKKITAQYTVRQGQ